jgi:hypothetical protein
MSSSTTEFHKIWIDQCAATEDIRDHFGLHSALDYLIGWPGFHHPWSSRSRWRGVRLRSPETKLDQP